MRVLCVTKIFPNAGEPELAPYNRHQFRELARRCDVAVLALVPWYPGSVLFRRGRARARIPREERIDGLHVVHPRVLYLPGVAQLSGPLYTASLLSRALGLHGRVDVVLGAFAYPDGWAAVALARVLGVPAVIKLHGSDINRLARDPVLRRHVAWTLRHAAAVVGPSRPLVERAVELGARGSAAHVVPNGVDRRRFHPQGRATCRARLGWPGDARPWIVYAGRLERDKGVLDLLAAFESIAAARPHVKLVLVGDGPARGSCERARQRGFDVVPVGARPPDEMPDWLGASNVVTLPSWAEGTPNVVLEAIACGRHVVASDVGGIADALPPAAGELVPARRPSALAEALLRALDRPGEGATLAAASTAPSWRESAAALYRVLSDVCEERLRRAA